MAGSEISLANIQNCRSENLTDAIIKHIPNNGLALEWPIATHVHADHLSAAPDIHKQLGGNIGIGAGIIRVQNVFGKIFNGDAEF